VAFLGDYIYEYPSPPTRCAARRRPAAHAGPVPRALRQYKRDPALQDAHAACPWLMVWDDHEVENDYAGAHPSTPLGADMAALRAAAYQAYWEHQPLPKALRPRGMDMRITAGWTGAAWRASTCWTRASTATPGLPARPAQQRVAHGAGARLRRPWPTRPARCWARAGAAGWPRAGAWTGRGTCWRSRR
jgi:hypothetical protein